VNIEDDFRDLAPLDPGRDAVRWESMVGAITRAAQPELARRSRMPAPGMLMLLSDWMRPAVSTAALLAAAAGTFLLTEQQTTATASTATTAGLADALYPVPVATWMDAGQAPSLEDMVTALEGDGQ